MGGPKKIRVGYMFAHELYLVAFTADTTGKLHILGHDGNSLGMDGAQISILKKTNKVGLGCLLY